MLGSISDLNGGSLQWSRWWKYCSPARHYTNLKNPHTNKFCMVTPIVSSKYRHLYQFCYVHVFSTNHNGNLLLLDDPGRVRSQIISVVCQIQRFDFDCNLVVTRKLIIRTCAPLRLKPLYIVRGHGLCKIPVLCHVHIIRFHFSEHHDLQKGPFADILSTCVQ